MKNIDNIILTKQTGIPVAVNEETIKISVVAPYLKDLGFTADEIDYETTFNIVLGRQVHTISSTEFVPVRGRSDILCRRGEKNLFIIEVKAENLPLTTEDAQQGISYARLLKQIAPFVIVTNGKGTQIFDTITHELLSDHEIGNQSSFWKNGCKLSTEDDLNIRDKALKNFISYSEENLRAFSGLQVADRMKILRAENDELHKKYIPKLFLEREGVHDEFDRFLESTSKCFAIIGESGTGKTNVICDLAEHSLNDHMVLFFNCIELNNSIIYSIQEDFNWSFSTHLHPEVIIARLSELTDGGNKRVCIFIDAIDESLLPNFDLDLDDFIRLLDRFPNIKVCISCKSTDWGRFMNRNGSPTRVFESLFKSFEERLIGSFLVRRFTDSELDKLDTLYRQSFNYSGSLEGNVRENCKLGFTLRVVSELHANQKLPEEMDDSLFLKVYLKALLQKMDGEVAKNYLTAIGRLVAQSPDDNSENGGLRGSIEEGFLRTELNLNPSEKIYPALFSYNLLSRTSDSDGRSYIGFTNTILRDYIIAILVYGLPNLNDEEFQRVLTDLIKNSAGRSAIQFYLKNASSDHFEVFKKFSIPGALEFLVAYEIIIENQFPKIKNHFQPHTRGPIGLVIVNPLVNDFLSFGLRPLKKGDDRIVIIQDDDREKLDGAFYQMGADWMPWHSNYSFNNPVDLAKINIAGQLEDIIREGRLFEGNCYTLAVEKIRAIVYTNLRTFGLHEMVKKHQQPFESFIPPLSLPELKRLTYLDIARYYAGEEIKQEKIDSGEVKVQREGNITRTHFNLTPDYYAEVEKRAAKMVHDSEKIAIHKVSGAFLPYGAFLEAIELVSKKQHKIKNTVLPPPDIQYQDIDKEKLKAAKGKYSSAVDIQLKYSDMELIEYVRSYNELIISVYVTMIEDNFPALKGKMTLYSRLPIEKFVWLAPDVFDRSNLIYGENFNSEAAALNIEVNSERISWKTLSDSYDQSGHSSIDQLFSSRGQFPLEYKYHSGTSDSLCLIRNTVYQLIEDEYDTLRKEILELPFLPSVAN